MINNQRWEKLAPGIRARLHPTRRHGVRYDRYFVLRYTVNGVKRQEALGWSSEGWTLAKAQKELERLREAARTGQGPATLKDMREEAEAQRRAEEAERKRQEVKGVTLSDFWSDDYLFALKNRVKRGSWEKEESHFRIWLDPNLGHFPLREISDIDLERLQDRMRVGGLSDRTQEYILGTFRRIWKHAAKRLIVSAECPVSKLEIRRPNNTRLRALKPDEFQAILEELLPIDQTAHDLTLFAGLTGCRASEAFNLQWEHVDLGRECVLFPETKNRDPREVYLSPELVRMMERRREQGDSGPVFTKRDGRPYEEAPSAFKTVVKKLGLNDGRGPRERISFHSLRHSAATFAARRGVPVKDMQEIFGWRTPSMVFRYAKGSEEVKRRAMRTLEHALTSETPGKILEFSRTGQQSNGES